MTATTRSEQTAREMRRILVVMAAEPGEQTVQWCTELGSLAAVHMMASAGLARIHHDLVVTLTPQGERVGHELIALMGSKEDALRIAMRDLCTDPALMGPAGEMGEAANRKE